MNSLFQTAAVDSDETGKNAPEIVHVKFIADPAVALSAPFTQVVRLQPKEGVQIEEAATLIGNLMDAMNADALGGEGEKAQLLYPGCTYGRILGKDELYSIVGWVSLEVS